MGSASNPRCDPSGGNEDMDRARRQQASADPATGDVVVTKVGTHYHIGRVQGVGQPFETIAVRDDRNDALALACRAVTARHRVFLYGQAGGTNRQQIDCGQTRDDS
jgi:O-acetyl-ADP-ribose deacetylase (regulator of RNase III)